MSLKQLNFAGLDRVQVAIKRLQSFEPPAGYYLAFSGGKDSVAMYHLAEMSGVKFDAHYNVTGVDAPEQVQFIKRAYPQVLFERPKETIWKGMLKHGLPTRQRRWCCELLKERSGDGRLVLLGVRWAESARRRTRPMYEVCSYGKGKAYLCPIIDWSTWDIWEYIRQEGIPYCSLYDEIGVDGKPLFKRLGCVLCPMTSKKQSLMEIERFPKMAEAWRRNARRFYDTTTQRGVKISFANFDELWSWWISREGQKKVSAQCFMFNDN